MAENSSDGTIADTPITIYSFGVVIILGFLAGS